MCGELRIEGKKKQGIANQPPSNHMASIGNAAARETFDFLMTQCAFKVLPQRVEDWKGCVISAPHGGYDLNTDLLVETIYEKVGIAAVIATGFRSRERRWWLNVNRPTEQSYKEGRFSRKERVTPVASWVYEEYQRRLFEAAEQSPLNLLIELHVGGIDLTAVEVVMPHFKKIQVRKTKKLILSKSRESYNGGAPHFQFHELLRNEGLEGGSQYEFKYPAKRTQRRGSLQRKNTQYGIHIEFPPSLVANVAAINILSSFLVSVIEDGLFQNILETD